MIVHVDANILAITVGPVIVTGRPFDTITQQEQRAIIAHERGHIHHRHTLKRLWWLISFQWMHLADWCKQQEHEADEYAVAQGQANGLYHFLTRVESHKSPLHPTPEERMENIRRVLHGR